MQSLQYDLRDPAAQESSLTHAAAVPRNLDAAITMRFAASRRKPARIYTHVATSEDDNHAAIPMRSATTDSRSAKNYAHRNNHSLQNT